MFDRSFMLTSGLCFSLGVCVYEILMFIIESLGGGRMNNGTGNKSIMQN